jgi:hypothetical protein
MRIGRNILMHMFGVPKESWQGWAVETEKGFWVLAVNLDGSQINPACCRAFLPTPSFRCDTAPKHHPRMRNLVIQQFALTI